MTRTSRAASPDGESEEQYQRVDAEEPGHRHKPRLLVDNANPNLTVAALRDILSDARILYDRGLPVRIARDQVGGVIVHVLSPDDLILLTHEVCRPYSLKMRKGSIEEVDVGLPRRMAVMYLGWQGEWNLEPLNGIAAVPLLHFDGSIMSGGGYDPKSGMWREKVPDLTASVPERPSFGQAQEALRIIRNKFKTFCFADAETIYDPKIGVDVVDISKLPGRDESAFLNGLLTAVCRPSLWLAPGLVLRAPPLSGAGTGKGLLARLICLIAFGRQPHAVTAGANAEELEKRISAELMQGHSALFLDNLNNTAFRSDLLASAITERPSRVRVLGQSKMVMLNANAFVVLTGNGLSVSEDLARRFLAVDLDAHAEDPEARSFQGDIKSEILAERSELLAALLTIWRWGRQQIDLPAGKPLGSFEQWSSWVRDPLLALGCKDPVEQISEAKGRDSRRQSTADLFDTWWGRHGERPITVAKLHDDVKLIADPQCRGRQFLTTVIGNLTDTRLNGFHLTRQAPMGTWSAATYSLKKTVSADPEEHRDHRGHNGPDAGADTATAGTAEPNQPPISPITPMTPMPEEDGGEASSRPP